MKFPLDLSETSGLLFDLLKRDKVSCLFFFLIGLALRGIPELLVTYYPVGFETITWYAPIMTRFPEMSLVEVFVNTFQEAGGPLFYAFMWFATTTSGAQAFLLLKVTGPVLYGCLAVVFYVFLRRGLNFEWKMAFVSSLLLVFQVAALRIAWDRLRNVFALIFVFPALTILKSKYRYKWPLLAGLSVLAVLSREYVAFVLFVTVLGFTVLERKNRIIALIALAPALTVFLFMNFPRQVAVSYILERQYALKSYSWLVHDVFSIFMLCYLPLLFFVLRGFKRDRLLDPMLSWLLLGSFSVVISPWLAVPGYQRWSMELVFPFSIYAVLGFRRFRLFDKGGFKKLAAILIVFILIGVGYVTGEFSYVGMLSNSYVPVNLVQSSITWNQVDDVKGALRWLDENAVSNSSIIAEERFYGWTLIYLKRANIDVTVIAYGVGSLPQPALERALENGFRWIYLIHNTVPDIENFHVIYSQNSTSIFQYER